MEIAIAILGSALVTVILVFVWFAMRVLSIVSDRDDREVERIHEQNRSLMNRIQAWDPSSFKAMDHKGRQVKQRPYLSDKEESEIHKSRMP